MTRIVKLRMEVSLRDVTEFVHNEGDGAILHLTDTLERLLKGTGFRFDGVMDAVVEED